MEYVGTFDTPEMMGGDEVYLIHSVWLNKWLAYVGMYVYTQNTRV